MWEEKRVIIWLSVFLSPSHAKSSQSLADASFHRFHLHNPRCYDSAPYRRQYAAAVMTTKRVQLAVVYHNYGRQSEHLSKHNEWAVPGAGCWSANEHWASPSIMPAINLRQLLTRACNEGVIFHGWRIAHIVTHWSLKILRWFRRPNGKEISKQSINYETEGTKRKKKTQKKILQRSQERGVEALSTAALLVPNLVSPRFGTRATTPAKCTTRHPDILSRRRQRPPPARCESVVPFKGLIVR